jgi:type II secretory pathway component PulJ
MTPVKITRGFTLIEAIIYLALFSILMGGAVVAAYGIFSSATRVGTMTMLQEESDFMLAKIEWVLSGAKAITAPAAGVTGTSLIVAKWDTTLGDPITVAKNGADLMLTLGSNPPVTLNNTNTVIWAISFNHLQDTGDGQSPEALETVLTLSSYTPTGAQVLRTATSTVYVRH